MRAGAYELAHKKDVPGRVVVAEYGDVASAFVERDEIGMVTAVLNEVGRHFRGADFTAN
jgi:N utilization substance protein B